MDLNELKKQCLVIDIETSAHYRDGREINIQSSFDDYIALAKVKWVGMYSYKYNKYYNINAIENQKMIADIISSHRFLVGFNNEEFDCPILENNYLKYPENKQINVDCRKILGKSSFKDKNGYSYKDRGTLMNYKFKKNNLRYMAEVMGLETQKGDINYEIFNKTQWTEEEKEEIVKYLGADIKANKEMFDKMWDYWKPFTAELYENDINNLSWIRSSIASLVYKSACYSLRIDVDYGESSSSFEEMGGRVINPLFEEQKDVWYVDFASLYPHIFCMFNLFDEVDKDTPNAWHGNDLFKVKGYYNIENKHKLSELVRKKLIERINLKKTDPDNPMIYTNKIFVNALYGIIRSAIFKNVYTKNSGWDCCFIGQQIHQYLEKRMKEFGFECIYGDSVCKDTPVYIKYKNQLQLIPIEDLFSGNKKRFDVSKKDIKILSDNKWTNIKYIYRHKCDKKMYRILTRKGFIECSEDHSLIINNIQIKPSNLKIGDNIELISNRLPEKYEVDLDLSWLLGFWMAEGSCGEYKDKKGTKYYWSLIQKDKFPLLKAKQILLKFGVNTKILNATKSSNCLKLVPDIENETVIYELFNKWCLSKKGIKKIPNFILQGSVKSKKSFLEGYLLGDRNLNKKDKIIQFGSIDKSLMCGLCNMFESLGEEYSLHIRSDNPNFIEGRIVGNIDDKKVNKENKILKIEEFNYNDYIYDIETNNHHFCGGIGNVNLHNTDSAMLYCKDKEKNNKKYVQTCLKIVVDEIMEKSPFPTETFKIDIEEYINYIMFPFSDQEVVDEDIRKNLKEGFVDGYIHALDENDKKIIIEENTGEIIKKSVKWKKIRKGKKKNYMYVYEDDGKKKIKLVGLPIIKDNATALGIKIYHEVLKQKIIDNNCAKFDKEFINKTIEEYLEKPEIMEIISVEYKIKPYHSYKIPSGKNEPTGIHAQISRGYLNDGDGIIRLIKNKKIGNAGKGFKYCTISEALENNLTIDDLDLEKLYNELDPFIRHKEEQSCQKSL